MTLLASHYVITEAETNLSLVKPESVGRLTELIAKLEIVEDKEGFLPHTISLDKKDVPVLLAAIASGATYLLTGDKNHFGHLFNMRIEGVLILPPSAYFATILQLR